MKRASPRRGTNCTTAKPPSPIQSARLNTNTIRDIATFQSRLTREAQSRLTREADLIKERIATINASLVDIDYNPGRYIRLEPGQTPNTDIREFRSDLRACTEGTVSPGGTSDDQYSEQKFLQVKRIIERFRGREGQTEADRRWTALVTDVRNWFLFSASERFREDGTEYERYADSAGKSGGQKEKLAYTVLAASLAYQFKLEWGAAKSRTFRFAVIDEAFGRGAGFTELSVRADELTAPPPGTRRAFIIGNEITYLAFPLPAQAIVINGSGYAAGQFGLLGWLADLDLIYWGDIDTHGLAILSRVRHRFPHTRSILMDEATLLAHRSQWGTEPDPTSVALTHLTAAEQSLYRCLLNSTFGERLRLEQEFISIALAIAAGQAT